MEQFYLNGGKGFNIIGSHIDAHPCCFFQRWIRQEKQIVHEATGKCLDSRKVKTGLQVSDCDEQQDSQKWDITMETTINLEKDYLDSY